MKRTVAYVAHQLNAESAELMAANRENAARWCVWLCRHFGLATIADWIVMSSVLEETEENRAMGLDCDLALIERAGLLILVGGRISFGMKIERDEALRLGVPILDLTWIGFACPSDDNAQLIEQVRSLLGAVSRLARSFQAKLEQA